VCKKPLIAAVASLALLLASRGVAEVVRWRQAAEVREVLVVFQEVTADDLQAIATEYEPAGGRGMPHRKGFSVLRTFADGSRRCDVWLLEGMVTTVKLATLGHEVVHCAGYTH
jgi:hypothetical protein